LNKRKSIKKKSNQRKSLVAGTLWDEGVCNGCFVLDRTGYFFTIRHCNGVKYLRSKELFQKLTSFILVQYISSNQFPLHNCISLNLSQIRTPTIPKQTTNTIKSIIINPAYFHQYNSPNCSRYLNMTFPVSLDSPSLRVPKEKGTSVTP
jgi:hypothetical protein